MISVIIPCFNAGAYIADTIQSVLNQDYEDFEIIVSDDGSTDDSLNVVRGFTDPRIFIITNPTNTGWAAANNRGIRAATRPLIAVLSSDDLLTRTSLQKRLQAIESVDVVCGQAVVIGPRTSLDDAYLVEHMPVRRQRFFYGPTVLLRRELFQHYGLFDESLPGRWDREMWIRLFGRKRERTDRAYFICLPDIVGFYRLRPDSIQQSYRETSQDYKSYVDTALELAIIKHSSNIEPELLLK